MNAATVRNDAKRATRADVHRPGAIVPSDYAHVLSYSLGGADGDPPINLDAARKVWMPDGTLPRAERFGTLGSCGVCGARFRHGDVFQHVPTGHLVSMGHDCAEKYELVANREDWLAELETLKRGRAARLEELRRDERFTWFVRSEDLADVFRVDHPILADMKQKIRKWGSISEKQIDLAVKIAREAWCPAKPTEKHVRAPEGRIVFRGVVVSKKVHEGFYGDTLKLVIKVHTPEGTWLAWGTSPRGLCAEKGEEIELTATLTRSDRDEHFAFFKRPSKARKIEEGT